MATATTAALCNASSTPAVWKIVSSQLNMPLSCKGKVGARAVVLKHGNIGAPENETGKAEYGLKVTEETHGAWAKLSNRCPLDHLSMQRRDVMRSAILLMMSAVGLPAIASEEEFTLYEDTEDKFSLLVPQVWTKGEGMTGPRKVTAFFPGNDTSANVNIVITGLGADYTALGSFGTIDIFAENLVNSLDRAWQKPKGQACKLVDSRSKDGMYYIEYTVQKPGEAKRHFLSVVGIAWNGWINRLYTVTGQYWEDDGEKYKATLEKAISSFRFA